MANSDKNILITPNIGANDRPSIVLTGVGNSDVNITIDDQVNPSLDFSTGNVGSATTVLQINSKQDDLKTLSIADNESISVVDIDKNSATFGSRKGKVTVGSDGIKLPPVNSNNLTSPRNGTLVFDGVVDKPKFYAKNSWKVLGSGQDGLTPDTAGSSAEQIKRDYPSSPNGNYWIIYEGVPHEVYCDMDTGGWMYLIPPVGAINRYALHWKHSQTASQINCSTDSYEDTSTYYYLYGYRCGTSSLTCNVTWRNSLHVKKVRFAAILNGGNSYHLKLNNYSLDPRVTGGSSYHRYYTYNQDGPSGQGWSCTTNMCFNTASYINALQPVEHELYGHDLLLQVYLNSACQPDCNWGVGYVITKLAVK